MLSDEEFLLKLKKFGKDVESFEKGFDALGNDILAVGNEIDRVRGLCANAHEIIDDIDTEFTRRTSLTGIDYTFLAIATALQTARWILIDYFTRFGDGAERDDRLDHDDRSIQDEASQAEQEEYDKITDAKGKDSLSNSHIVKAWEGKTWESILLDSVPFDTTKGSARFDLGHTGIDADKRSSQNKGISGVNHREMTLGHDPLLGWFFGTVNIMTDTTTMKDLRTFRMSRHTEGGSRDLSFSYETLFPIAFQVAVRSAKQDKKRLWCALTKEGIHLKSDFFTKCGLPIPVLPLIAPELSSRLYKENYDALCLVKDIGIIGLQAGLSVLINLIISFIHGLYFNPTQHKTRDLYEVKTRKILLLSNVFASGSNLISVAVRSGLGDPSAWKHLDFGGVAVTLWRIITDIELMRKVRAEYIRGEFKKLLAGNELDLKEI